MFTTSHALGAVDPSTDAIDESGHSQASPAAAAAEPLTPATAAAERWALSFSPSHHRHCISSGSTPLKSLKRSYTVHNDEPFNLTQSVR